MPRGVDSSSGWIAGVWRGWLGPEFVGGEGVVEPGHGPHVDADLGAEGSLAAVCLYAAAQPGQLCEGAQPGAERRGVAAQRE